MTHRAVGFGRGFPRSWLFPIGALTVLLGVAASGRFSRAIVADLIAWWPVWLGLGITAYLLRERKIGNLRVAGLVPLVALTFVLLFAWGHLGGWSLMPSASQRLVGPELGSITEASLTAVIDGRIDVAGGSSFLYVVEPIMRGGGIGIPTASEQLVDSSISVVLEPPVDTGLYVYAGWHVALSSTPQWSLVLDGAIDADLTDVHVVQLSVDGAGTVVLGESLGETPVAIGGSFRVVVPPETPARVVGVATVPDTWTITDDGATSPGGGDGWVLKTVDQATLTVSEG